MKTSGKCQPQRERLNQFVDLARVYRGWTRGELSKALGRDPSKIVPESGNPKLDLLVGLVPALGARKNAGRHSVCQSGFLSRQRD